MNFCEIVILLGFYAYLLTLMWWVAKGPPDFDQEDMFP